MRIATFTAMATVALAATPVMAQTAADPANVRPEDVVTSPLTDINLMKKDVPTVLVAALDNPYDFAGIKSCVGFTTAIMDLDMALGDDIDVAQTKTTEEKLGNGAGAIAKSVIGSFIPFRSVIRQISGANAQQRAWDRALYAGSVRRAFLKGMGQSKGCAYPASAATPQVLAMLSAQRDAERAAKKVKPLPAEQTAGAPVEVAPESRAVVQQAGLARR